MKLNSKDSLLGRLLVSILLTAMAVGFIASELYYMVVYNNSLKHAEIEISKLHETVASTSSIAAFLDDQELAKEVVNGLIVNDVVMSAALSTAEIEVTNGRQSGNGQQYHFDITSPFSEQVVGQLTIVQDLQFITQRARKNADYNASLLFTQALIITFVCVLNVFILVTKPLSYISKQLSKISPPSRARIKKPIFHRKGELGRLTTDVNALLVKTDKALKHELEYRKEIEALEARLRLVFDYASNPIVLTDTSGNLILANQSFDDLLSFASRSKQKNMGKFLNQLFENGEAIEDSFEKQLALSNTALGEFKLLQIQCDDSVDNKPRWFQIIATSISTEDFKDYIEISLHDISNKKEKLEALSSIVDLDPLTQAFNRNGLKSKLELMSLSYANYAVLFIDIDNFKEINDTYGHQVGDDVLIEVVKRFKSRLRQGDIVCRWGGDEFILLLADVNELYLTPILSELSDELRREMRLPYLKENLTVEASIGVSFYPQSSRNTDTLIKLADEGMYKAKLSRQKDALQSRIVD
ncbi:sensor domain-containing diguanylate cyclase [Agaribacter flavus]|uniref:Diguanylate cyclase domain-containing protein n=1 Tax=Agaribacter flavus TaxID=1902781 RepID=A0ABV7FRB2_9ALTE